MDPERWKRIDSLFHAALEHPPAARDAFLRQECAGDPGLENEVRSLMASEQPAERFLDGMVQAEIGPRPTDSQGITHPAGETVSHYRILEMLGAGGMGVVYKAFDTKLGRPVALKFLPPHLRNDHEWKRRLNDEARAASTLDHPNIVVIHDIEETPGGDLFIAMAFHEGVTLRDCIEREKPKGLPVADALRIARQIAAGLGSAHERGILHRDIKPSNVIVAKDGVARIIDFGLAKASDATATLDGSTKGTPLYMSPEQASGNPLDYRTDLWSLGAVLFEMLAGRPPFTGEGNLSVLHAIVHDEPARLRDLRPGLPPAVERIVTRAMEKDVTRRYQTAGEMASDLEAALGGRDVRPMRRGFPVKVMAGGAAAIALAAIGAGYFFAHRVPKLTDRDTVILAEFKNTTGDAVFDETLRQALAAHLDESPFLKLIADDRIQQTLKLMNRPADAALTPEVARDICVRTGSTAVLNGTITRIGTQFVLTLGARNCRSGDILAREQATAARKEDVLSALSQIGNKVRGRLGESLAIVRKHETPLAEATTPSLEALKAYTTGMKIWSSNGPAAAVPFFQHAVEIDPQFALAYSDLGGAYNALWEPVKAAQAIGKAYELRNRANERERFQITLTYQLMVTRNLEKVAETARVWAATYPRDGFPPGMLAWMDQEIGSFDKSIEDAKIAVDLDPDNPADYNNLAWAYVLMNRLTEAESTLRRASERRLDFPEYSIMRYYIAFLRGDQAGMEREAALGQRKTGVEDWIAYEEATVLAHSGQMRAARSKSRLAVEMAGQPALRERAASYEAGTAVREAFFGNDREARQHVTAALDISRGRDVVYGATLALALAGDTARSQELAKELGKAEEDTYVQFHYLPTLRALWALSRSDSAEAIEQLQKAARYEMGIPGSWSGFYGLMCPVYVRGLAYLKAGRAGDAAAEFQKILDRPYIVFTDPVGVMARVGIARALVLAADTVRGKAAYEDFLSLWKNADRDIPILREVATEYAKLR